MILSTESPVYKWAYMIERHAGDYIPKHTSVCSLFWRCVVFTPVLGTVILLLYSIFKPIFMFVNWNHNRRYNKLVGPHEYNFWDLVVDMAKAVKQKVCPLIKWQAPQADTGHTHGDIQEENYV